MTTKTQKVIQSISNTQAQKMSATIKGLYISAFAFAIIGMFQKILLMLKISDPIHITLEMVTKPLEQIPIARQIAKIIMGLADAFTPLAVILLLTAVVLQQKLLVATQKQAENTLHTIFNASPTPSAAHMAIPDDTDRGSPDTDSMN